MFNLNHLFGKIKSTTTELEKVLEMGLITKEEFLRLKEHRALEELEKYLETKKPKLSKK